MLKFEVDKSRNYKKNRHVLPEEGGFSANWTIGTTFVLAEAIQIPSKWSCIDAFMPYAPYI